MIQKLRILIIILLLNYPVFSQTDTSKICLPYPIAKRVAIDLVRGDSAISELKHTSILIQQYQQSIIERDSIIKIYQVKTQLYNQEISLRDTTLSLQKYMISELKSDNITKQKQLSIYKSATKYLSAGLIGTMAVISFFLYIK